MDTMKLKPTDKVTLTVRDFETKYVSRVSFDEQREQLQQTQAALNAALLDLHNTDMTRKWLSEENQRVRMLLMPILDSEDPAEYVEKLQATIAAQAAEIERLRDAVNTMWPVFALALAWEEHGKNSELVGLRHMAGEFRNGPPAGVLDTILRVVSEPLSNPPDEAHNG